MTDATPKSPSPRPLYSPRSPVLRVLLVLLVAGFVILQETFYSLFKRRTPVSLTLDESANKPFSQPD